MKEKDNLSETFRRACRLPEIKSCAAFVRAIALAILILIASANPILARPSDEPAVRPNVVFFLIDDLGYADCGFNGGKDIKTPNIDDLASRGAVLKAHYVQPVCSPTRATLMTGRTVNHTGVYTIVRPNAKWGLPLQERTLAQALQECGYQTAITGKWHLGEFEPDYRPMSRGFAHQYGHYFGAIDYFTHQRDTVMDWYRDEKPLNEAGYSTVLVAAEACRLIESGPAAAERPPLFLYVPFNGVHSPMQVPEKYLAPYSHLKGNRRQLAGMLAAVDEAIGRIVVSLKSAGLYENTLIVFSADNGGPNPGAVSDNGNLRAGKGTLYEGGIRGCAFATWEGRIPAGQVIHEPVQISDWYPTLISLCGAKPEQVLPVDGRDILGVLTRQEKSPHETILVAQSPDRAALRSGDYKLLIRKTVNNGKAGNAKKKNAKKANPEAEVELYNLAADPSESINLASTHPEQVARMRKQMQDLLKDAVPARTGAEAPDAE